MAAGAARAVRAERRDDFVGVARSAGVTVDENAVLRALTAGFGGRGGGKPELAQGGGLSASAGTILTDARSLVISSTPPSS
jgi:alanyl-tRNA synthetase